MPSRDVFQSFLAGLSFQRPNLGGTGEEGSHGFSAETTGVAAHDDIGWPTSFSAHSQ
jgi:hypothetical protein